MQNTQDVLWTSLFAVVALVALWLRRFALAKFATIGQVTLILEGWSLAHYPNLVTPDITMINAAAPEFTLRLMVIVLEFGALFCSRPWAICFIFSRAESACQRPHFRGLERSLPRFASLT